MIKELGMMSPQELPLSILSDIRREELSEDNAKLLHVVVMHCEVAGLLRLVGDKIQNMGFKLGELHFSGASIVRQVGPHVDSNVPESEAFILIVTHVNGRLEFYVGENSIELKEGQVLYFDPHTTHGIEVKSDQADATVIRIPVIRM